MDLFVVDEIGTMELICNEFIAAVPRLRGGPVPVLATVATKGVGLIDAVKTRADVRQVEVTEVNLDGSPEELERWVRERVT